MKKLILILSIISTTAGYSQSEITGQIQNGVHGIGVTGGMQNGVSGNRVTGGSQNGASELSDCQKMDQNVIACSDGEYVKVPSTSNSIRMNIEKEFKSAEKNKKRSQSSAQ